MSGPAPQYDNAEYNGESEYASLTELQLGVQRVSAGTYLNIYGARNGQLAADLSAATGLDKMTATSLLAAFDWDLAACIAAVRESHHVASELTQTITVQVQFEEVFYKLSLLQTSSIHDVKSAITKETSIVADEQTLVDARSQMEISDDSAALATLAPPGGVLHLHLLSPNSSA